MTLDDVRAFGTEVVVLGIGSTEPHGPILPYGTDYFYCDALCRRAVRQANERGARALMYPTFPIGNNVNFKAWPFACRIGVRTLMLALLDVISAVEEDGVRKVVFVNGHGGNTDAIRAALREHFHNTPRERRAFVCMSTGMAASRALDHGGEVETSCMMRLKPDLVRTEHLQDMPFGKPTLEWLEHPAVYWVRPWHLHVPMGGGGETRDSSAEKGEDYLASAAENLAALLVELSGAPWHPDFPYAPQPE